MNNLQPFRTKARLPPPDRSRPAMSGARARAETKLRAFHEEDAVTKTYDGRLLARLWPYLRPYLGLVVASLATLLLIAGLNLVRPLLMGAVVSSATARDRPGLLRSGGTLAGLVVVVQLLSFVGMYMMQLAGARTMGDLREKIFVFLQSLQLRYFDRTPVGRLVTRATNDVDAVGELFASGVLLAFIDCITLLGIVGMMLVLDWRLSLIAFAALPLVGLVVRFVRKRSRLAYRDIRLKTARLNAFLNEQVQGIAVIQAYAREAAMASEFDEINDAYRDANKRSILYEAILDASIEMVGTVCIASVLWYAGFRRVGSHPVTFPLVVTFTQYIKQFFEPVSLLAQRYTILQSAMSGAERIFKLFDEAEVDPPRRALAECAAEGPPDEAVAFDDVVLEYKKDVPVLSHVSFGVKRGEKVALVGATGAGKTSVASLVLRLYEAKSGTIRVLGRDVRSYERVALREQFSVVPQDVFLFAGTVLSNIAMADKVPDRARAEKALRRIGAWDAFAAREGGLDARIDERGANFSAGERQLIAFARAMYRAAPLVILDEATASIDSDTEANLQEALAAVMEGRTALVIAHRLSTIRAVDRILVFHKGHLVENGSHDELLARGEVYARLYRMQFAHEKLEADAAHGTSTPLPVASVSPSVSLGGTRVALAEPAVAASTTPPAPEEGCA